MTEVLSELAICQTQIAARQSVHGGDCAATILRVCRSHEELRARLESVEAARRDAQESRFGLIIQNEELGADLAATRARLESAEAALRKAESATMRCKNVGGETWWECDVCKTNHRDGTRAAHHNSVCPFGALGAAGEKENRSDG